MSTRTDSAISTAKLFGRDGRDKLTSNRLWRLGRSSASTPQDALATAACARFSDEQLASEIDRLASAVLEPMRSALDVQTRARNAALLSAARAERASRAAAEINPATPTLITTEQV